MYQAAKVTLQRLAYVCGYCDSSVADNTDTTTDPSMIGLRLMIIDNADYLVEAIGVRLRSNSVHSSEASSSLVLPRVLSALLLKSAAGPNIVSRMKDILQNILETVNTSMQQSLNTMQEFGVGIDRSSNLLEDSKKPSSIVLSSQTTDYNEQRQLAYVQVILGVVTAIGANYSIPKEKVADNTKISHFSAANIASRLSKKASTLAAFMSSEISYLLKRCGSSGGAACDFFQDYHAEKEDDSKAEPETAQPEESIIPPDLKVVSDIILDCRPLLAVSSLKLQILTLSIIERALPILSSRQDAILPLLAQIWPTLALRLRPAFALYFLLMQHLLFHHNHMSCYP